MHQEMVIVNENANNGTMFLLIIKTFTFRLIFVIQIGKE